MQIDRARTNVNFDFCWNTIRQSWASPLAVVTRTIQGLVYMASILYVDIILKYTDILHFLHKILHFSSLVQNIPD